MPSEASVCVVGGKSIISGLPCGGTSSGWAKRREEAISG